MLPELNPWLGMLNLLKSGALTGCAPDILKRGDVQDGDFQVFAALENTMNKYRIKQQKRRNS